MLTENGSLQSSFGIQSSWLRLPIRKFKVDYTRKISIGCGNGCGPKNWGPPAGPGTDRDALAAAF